MRPPSQPSRLSASPSYLVELTLFLDRVGLSVIDCEPREVLELSLHGIALRAHSIDDVSTVMVLERVYAVYNLNAKNVSEPRNDELGIFAMRYSDDGGRSSDDGGCSRGSGGRRSSPTCCAAEADEGATEASRWPRSIIKT